MNADYQDFKYMFNNFYNILKVQYFSGSCNLAGRRGNKLLFEMPSPGISSFFYCDLRLCVLIEKVHSFCIILNMKGGEDL